MARPIPSSPTHHVPLSSMSTKLLSLVLTVLSVISMVTLLCAGSNKMKKFYKQTEEEADSDSKDATLLKKLNSSLSNKARSMVKMMSWRKVQADEEEEEEEYSDEGDEALWRKNILMGERCRPLDFSGKILYDSQGNMIPDSSSDHPNGYNQKLSQV